MVPGYKSFYIGLALSIAAAGCALPPRSSEATSGNEGKPMGKDVIPSSPLLGCKNIADIDNKTAPPKIYGDMKQCAENGNYEGGAVLFALAGAYGFFDALRVEDTSAFPVLKALPRKNFDELDAAHRDSLKAAIKHTLGNDAKLATVCGSVMRAGPPDYYPAYMIVEGEKGASIVKKGGGLISPFDSRKAWEETLRGFLHCPLS